MPKIYDNAENKLADGLQNYFAEYQNIDIATGYIDLRGWNELSEHIAEKPFDPDKGPVARILVGMVARSDAAAMIQDLDHQLRDDAPTRTDSAEAGQHKQALVQHLREQLTRGLSDAEGEKSLKELMRQLKEGRVQMKIYAREPLHGKTYIMKRESYSSSIVGILGSSNFTRAGLNTNKELNIDVEEGDAARKLEVWFEKLWNDRFSIEITDEIIELISQSWAGEILSPYDIYLKICYWLSQDMRDGLGYVLPSELKELLLDYQESAVRILARRIVRRGGTMLGDVVGLGKTLTAVATAAMLQNGEEYTTLILCPKNLVGMWKKHLKEYDLIGEVISYSQVHTELPDLRRYRLVICDESHNLRNEGTRAYGAIKEYVSANDSKVLLLTATPYNLSFKDVANQLGLYIDDDDDLGISPAAALEKNPNLKYKLDSNVTTLKAFRESEEPEDWRRLMSDHLVRRTRSFVKKRSKKTMRALPDGTQVEREFMEYSNGEKFFFPVRLSQAVSHDFSHNDPARLMEDEQTLSAIEQLDLPRYRLERFDSPKRPHTPEDQSIMDDVKSGRGNVAGFVRAGLYKRLSSSGYSFIESLKRQRSRNEVFVYAIDHKLKLPLGSFTERQFGSDLDLEDSLAEAANAQIRYESLVATAPKSTRWLNSTIFTDELRSYLVSDNQEIDAMLERFGKWDYTRDSKLIRLKELVEEHAGEKVLVFTEYKDTAQYIADSLEKMGVQNVAAVTGDSKNPATLAQRFSPKSNKLPGMEESEHIEHELDVLVATDVLSEGQNLQDAHIVVNYDLPWAIIRLVQRAGRVDRIGQESDVVKIYLISHENIEEQLSLRSRIKHRLGESAQAFGSDESFFGDDAERQILDDFYNGKISDDVEDEGDGADAVSEAWEVWSAVKENNPSYARKIEHMQDLVHATRLMKDTDRYPCVATYIATEGGLDLFAIGEISEESSTVKPRLMTADEALRLFRADPSTPGLPMREDLYDQQAQLVRFALEQDIHAQGNLKGVRKRVWNKLRDKTNQLPLEDVYGEDVKDALNALAERPLQKKAEQRFSQLLRSRVSERTLADHLVLLHQEEKLVVKASGDDLAKIVCTLGVVSHV